jgi:hypothetical protein
MGAELFEVGKFIAHCLAFAWRPEIELASKKKQCEENRRSLVNSVNVRRFFRSMMGNRRQSDANHRNRLSSICQSHFSPGFFPHHSGNWSYAFVEKEEILI